MTEWERDCLRERGRLLTGDFGHYCAEFDGLPVDETCGEEWDCCLCYRMEPSEALSIALKLAVDRCPVCNARGYAIMHVVELDNSETWDVYDCPTCGATTTRMAPVDRVLVDVDALAGIERA